MVERTENSLVDQDLLERFKELSFKQARMLIFIADYHQENGDNPSIRDICNNIRNDKGEPISTSVANYNLDRLREKELLAPKAPNRARSIKILEGVNLEPLRGMLREESLPDGE